MAWIRMLEPDEVEGSMKSVYKGVERGGEVSDIIKIHSLNERAFRSFIEFTKLLFFSSQLERPVKEMIAVAVSAYNDCFY